MQIQPYEAQKDRTGRRGEHWLSRKEQYAFTLVEVMIAVFFLAVLTLSLYAGFATGFMVVDSAREDLRAAQVLMQKAEAIRLCTWSSLSNCPISFVERYDPAGSANGATAGGVFYTGTISTNSVTGIPDSAAYKTNMCLATITVYWTNYYGNQSIVHSRQLQTFIARYGIQNYIWGVAP